jgi:hypothetical protein
VEAAPAPAQQGSVQVPALEAAPVPAFVEAEVAPHEAVPAVSAPGRADREVGPEPEGPEAASAVEVHWV